LKSVGIQAGDNYRKKERAETVRGCRCLHKKQKRTPFRDLWPKCGLKMGKRGKQTVQEKRKSRAERCSVAHKTKNKKLAPSGHHCWKKKENQ